MIGYARQFVVAASVLGVVALGAPAHGQSGAVDLRNNDGLTPLDLVADSWSVELDGLYEFLSVAFQMNLDIGRIQAVRPEVRAILESAGWPGDGRPSASGAKLRAYRLSSSYHAYCELDDSARPGWPASLSGRSCRPVGDRGCLRAVDLFPP